MDRIERLIAADDIRQLPKLYCHYVRLRDVDGILSLYSDNCEFEAPNVKTESGVIEAGVSSGKQGLRSSFEHFFKTIDPWAFTHNHIIEFTGDETAKGCVYVEVRSGDEGMRLAIVGYYDDEYVKEADKWLFKSRRLKRCNQT